MSVKVMTHVFDHSASSGNTRVVLLALADHAHDDGTSIYPSHTEIARKARCSPRTVARCLGWLEDAGEIARDGFNDKTQTVRWRISMDLPVTYDNLADPPPEDSANRMDKPDAGPDEGGSAEMTGVGPEGESDWQDPQSDCQGGSANGVRGGLPTVADEPSVNRQVHTHAEGARARELEDGVLAALVEVAGAKMRPAPTAAELSAIAAEFGDRDQAAEADRFRGYFTEGEGSNARPRSIAATWRSWLQRAPVAGTEPSERPATRTRGDRRGPLDTPEESRRQRAERAGDLQWAVVNVPELDAEFVASAYRTLISFTGSEPSADQVRTRLAAQGRDRAADTETTTEEAAA